MPNIFFFVFYEASITVKAKSNKGIIQKKITDIYP